MEDAVHTAEHLIARLLDAGGDPEEFKRCFAQLQRTEEDLDVAALAYLECSRREPGRALTLGLYESS